MKNSLRKFLVFILFISTGASTFAGDKEIAQKIDEFMNQIQKDDFFSGTILVANRGNIIYEKAFGYADKESGKLNELDTKFNIGSIGKLFTKIMILQLREERKLDFNDKLGKFLDFFGKNASEKVTIANLLDMTSGFGDYMSNPEYNSHITDYKKTMDLVKLISKESLAFEPGTDKAYSNSGYAILGGIIESVTGKDYVTNLKERILDRLKMNSSDFLYSNSNDPKKSIGYIKEIDGNTMSNSRMPMQPSPAGGMFSTIEDMLKLDVSLRNDNMLLKDESKPFVFGEVGREKSFTWEDMKNNPKTGAAFAGGAPGINAIYGIEIGAGYSFIILSNYHQAAIPLEKSFSSILRGGDYTIPNPPLGIALYRTVKEKGADYLRANFSRILEENGYKIEDDGLLNQTGYQFLQKNMPDAAIVIFEKNVELFPGVANCYDSLGEALMNAGKYAEAKKNYEKVLEMQPGNPNAKNMIEEINKKINN